RIERLLRALRFKAYVERIHTGIDDMGIEIDGIAASPQIDWLRRDFVAIGRNGNFCGERLGAFEFQRNGEPFAREDALRGRNSRELHRKARNAACWCGVN